VVSVIENLFLSVYCVYIFKFTLTSEFH